MSLFAVVLLVAAVVLLIVAEWPRLAARLHIARPPKRRKSHLRVVSEDPDESEDFARSVERDLASLPTWDPRDADKRR